MSLSNRLAQPPTTAGRVCAVGALLSVLQEPEKTALENALKNMQWGHAALTRELQAEGYDVSLRQIERHRRGECKCPKR